MRVTKEKAAENRARIVAAAARLFRERGFEATGIDAIMQAVGVTHGGFYRYFRSKDELAAAALTETLAGSLPQDAALPPLDRLVGSYLSPRHRDDPGAGCMVAACGGEIARQGPAARAATTAHLRTYLDRLARIVRAEPDDDRRSRAIATFSGMVGALVLARTVDDPALADDILAAGRKAFGGVTPAEASATQAP